MIKPDRLKELIFQEKGCYVMFGSDIGYIHLNKQYEPELQKNRHGEYFIYLYTNNDFETKDIIYIYNLFETEEEAKWFLEFGNITRTETLSLPSWEELTNKIEEGKPFKMYFNNEQFLFVSRLIVKVGKYDTYDIEIEPYFCEGTTKENYIEACRLAKKLFLGEKDE